MLQAVLGETVTTVQVHNYNPRVYSLCAVIEMVMHACISALLSSACAKARILKLIVGIHIILQA